jgi:hypothetical protein
MKGSEATMKYSVILSAHGNPDHYESPYEKVAPSAVKHCKSIEECQAAVREYIDKHGLGGGNFTGGDVYQYGEVVGRISYNGRYWPLGSEYCPE